MVALVPTATPASALTNLAPSPIAGGAGSATVSVFVIVTPNKPGKSATDSPPFQFNYSVAITAIDPSSASPAGETPLTITGHGFGVPPDEVLVEFCPEGTNLSISSKGCKFGADKEGEEHFQPLSDTTIKVDAPDWPIAGGAGSATVWFFVIVTPNKPGKSATDSPPFQYKYG
jgi:hypothetical protein